MQPVRSADYPAHPSLRQVLTLPEDSDIPEATPDEALAAWRDYLGFSGPLLLVSNPDRARKLLMAALGVAGKEPVAIPANTRRYLSEAVKRSGGKPLFVELDADLEFVPETPGLAAARVLWAQPVGGMAPPAPLPGKTYLVDHGLTLPAPLSAGGPGLPGAATVFGLHLDADEHGALVAFNDVDLAARVAVLMTPEDAPDSRRALAQAQRVAGPSGLAARLLWLDAEVRLGMEAGAGLPMAARADGVLSHGLPVRIPEEADIATFISYVRNELVSLDWLPEVQPMFYVAYQVTQDAVLTRRTAEHLSRWVISPIGPDFVDDEITHAVLGVLKAGEYTGVRWYTDPGRARWYSELLVDWYGPEHDAYHPAFAITVPARE
ncbi:MAG: hypothetical protein KC442_00570, partial [Thermomicrobiales bacterium]|nr:hypothetical protein [Thermomicrobiales bacterium]